MTLNELIGLIDAKVLVKGNEDAQISCGYLSFLKVENIIKIY